MIPLRSLVPRTRLAVVTAILIALNVVAFLFELSLGRQLPAFIGVFGLRPAVATSFLWTLDPARLVPMVTSMFLHGGWLHLAGNMLFLWVFGAPVEDRLGSGRFLALYVLGGLAAATAQIAVAPDSLAPMIGASGAIAAVLGAYLYLFPRSRVLTAVPIVVVFVFWRLPAVLFLVVWFAMQFASGVASIETGQALYGGVAYWAHIGGFLAGVALAINLTPDYHTPRRPFVWAD